MSGGEKRLQGVYGAESTGELAARYDEWAENYEKDVLGFGYLIPAIAAGLVGRYVSTASGGILDAGAGTGLMGEVLVALGYKDLTGIDLSENMLDAARKKNVYKELHQMVLGERLDFPDNAFAATVATGVFTEGHAPAESFDELVRVTASGGCVIYSARADADSADEYEKRREALESSGKWSLVETTEPYGTFPLGDREIKGRVFVCCIP